MVFEHQRAVSVDVSLTYELVRVKIVLSQVRNRSVSGLFSNVFIVIIESTFVLQLTKFSSKYTKLFYIFNLVLLEISFYATLK